MTIEAALYVLVVSAGLVAVSIAMRNPQVGIGLWLAIYPLTTNFVVPEGLDRLTPNRLVTALLFLTCLPRLLSKPLTRPIRISFWIYGAFLVSALASGLSSSIPGSSIARSLSYGEPVLWLGLGAVAATGERPRESSSAILLGIAVGLAIVIAVGFRELLSQSNPLLSAGISRTTGDYMIDQRLGFSGRLVSTLGQPVYAGIYAVTAIAAVAAYGGAGARSDLTKLFTILLCVAAAAFAYLTGTRGAVLGLAVLPFAYLFFRGRRAAMVWLGIAAILIGSVVFLELPSGTTEFWKESVLVGEGGAGSANVLGRFWLTSRMLDVFSAHPLLGVGPGFFQNSSSPWPIADIEGLEGIENQYATILAENGIVGGVLFAGFLVYLVYQLSALARRGGDRRVAWAGAALTVLALVAVSCSVLSTVPMFVAMAIAGNSLGGTETVSMQPARAC